MSPSGCLKQVNIFIIESVYASGAVCMFQSQVKFVFVTQWKQWSVSPSFVTFAGSHQVQLFGNMQRMRHLPALCDFLLISLLPSEASGRTVSCPLFPLAFYLFLLLPIFVSIFLSLIFACPLLSSTLACVFHQFPFHSAAQQQQQRWGTPVVSEWARRIECLEQVTTLCWEKVNIIMRKDNEIESAH